MLPEKKEGYDAYNKGESKDANPYNWSNQTWWMVEAWDEGWNEAKEDDYDDDDD